MCDGLFSTRTDCCSEIRSRNARFMRRVTHRRGRPCARDRDSSRQVWSAEEGYPGDPAYREFYRDIGFDLPLEHLGPVARGIRKFSGVKYHRITGRGPEKELYDRAAAERAADAHATHFLEERRAQLRELNANDVDPIVVVP